MPETVTATVSVTINGATFDAPKGQLVIDAAEQHGVYIPRFCYHPRMQSVGMCRMCIVDIDTGRGATLQPACMIPVAPDMKVDTASPATKKAQDGVLEFLLINHPLDCPVCDKGGECPLQDQTMAYGPGESRFVEEKRHYEKPIPISQTVYLDRERCIVCDRCTRFAADVAGDPLISFTERGANTQVLTFPDEPFSSYFSGNTVQICPVGALTAKPYRFRARPWDLEKVESTCTTCAVGCRVTIESSRNQVLRYQGVDIDPVNWGWLCDKGRFDFEAINSPDRLSAPLVRAAGGGAGGELGTTTWSEALLAAAQAVTKALQTSGPTGVAFLGGARFSNEAAYAWAKLAKGVIGTDNVDCQLGDGLPADLVLGLPRATIDDVCAPGGTVIVLAPDVKEELPVLYLRLRHAAVYDRVRIIELAQETTGLTPYAAASLRCRPGTAADVLRTLLNDGDGDGAPVEGSLAAAAIALKPDARVTVVLGRPSLAESADMIVDAASVVLEHLPAATFLPVLRRGNVHGAIDMGLSPGLLPGRVTLDDGRQHFHESWTNVPDARGLDAAGILQAAADGKIDTLFLLGADPLDDFPDRALATRALAGARTVIAVDTFLSDSARQADVVLAAAGYGEVAGTTTNIEGRVSTLGEKVTPPGTARPDWMLAAELAYRLDADLSLESVDGVWDEIERLAPAYAGLTGAALRSPAAQDGVVVPLGAGTSFDEPGTAVSIEGHEIPGGNASAEEPPADEPSAPAPPGLPLVRFTPPERPAPAPAVDAYSLRLVSGRKLYDRGVVLSQSPSMAGLAPGGRLRLNPYDFDRLGVAPGGRVKVTSSRTSVTAEAVADTGVPRGSAAITFNQAGLNAGDLIDATLAVNDVRVETVEPSS